MRTHSRTSSALFTAATLAALMALAGTACAPPATPGTAVLAPIAEHPNTPAEPVAAEPAAPQDTSKCPPPPTVAALPGEPVTGEWVPTASCLRDTVLGPGAGSQPKSRLSTVRAHYTGWLVDGTTFDSSVARGKPFDFRLSQVIPGWTEAMLGMKTGEKRKLMIPSKLAYGREGTGTIPPKATLIFDVELIDVLVE